jgi:FkbM family methyltransferase
MKFVSYAQNFEDVLLWRALAKVERGFYIDVGAAEPFADSVTAAFYERGWRGINIEPMSGPFGRLVEARPQDINLNIAVENKRTAARYFSVDGGNGISTGVKTLADTYRVANWDVSQVTVTLTPLRDVCEKYVGNRPIHFLKVDVEGNEREVLASADFSKFRPWIIVVEATEPNSPIPSHQAWEGLLLDASYRLVYFDGLNRYYLAEEQYEELAGAFSTPPNWFDGFVRASEELAERRAADLETRLSSQQQDLEVAQRAWQKEKEAREQVGQMLDDARKGWLMEKGARESLEGELLRSGNQSMQFVTKSAASVSSHANDVGSAREEGLNYRGDVCLVADSNLDERRSHLEDSERRVMALEKECEICYQEMFESSRHAAWLSQERVRLQSKVEELERVASQHAAWLSQEQARLQSRVEELERVASQYKSQTEQLYASTSWRLTKPLRGAKRALQRK